MSKRLFLLVLAALMSSCSSFNTYTFFQTTHTVSGVVEKTETSIRELPQTEDTGPNIEVCPLYKLPVIPKTPELPLKELQAASPKDMEALDTIQRKHIEELRLYIARLKSALTKAQVEYLESCKIYMDKNK